MKNKKSKRKFARYVKKTLLKQDMSIGLFLNNFLWYLETMKSVEPADLGEYNDRLYEETLRTWYNINVTFGRNGVPEFKGKRLK